MNLREYIESQMGTFGKKLDKYNEQTQKNKTDILVLSKTTISVKDCETQRNIVFKEIRRVGRVNKIVGALATLLGAIGAGIMWLIGSFVGGK